MRKAGNKISATITTFYFGVFSAIFSFLGYSFVPDQELKTPLDMKEVGLLIATGLFGWLA
jgi:hypothetical protein